MLSPIDWQDEHELFEAVAVALDQSDEFESLCLPELSPYNDRGSVVITTKDGRRFYLSLSREH